LDGEVKQPVKLPAAAMHPLRRSGLGQPAFFTAQQPVDCDDRFNRMVNGSYGS
jgi:hypothetical protein